MADMDEYIVPRAPETLGSLLRKYPEAAYLTHAQTAGAGEMCVEGRGEGAFILERLIFRWPGLFCAVEDESKFPDRNYCLDHYGHRKYFLNPRKVRDGGCAMAMLLVETHV